MKKFVLLPTGFEQPTLELRDAWSDWFLSIGEKLVDGGNPFAPGKEITRSGNRDLPYDEGSITGYLIINAEGMDEAVKIAEGCPFASGIRVYEALAM